MTEVKTKVTLVGTVMAKQGVEFIYEGEVAGRDNREVKKACNNLQPGSTSMVSVRTTRRQCGVPFNGTAALQVMDAPVFALINADMAIVNSKIKLDLSCPKTECRLTISVARMALLRGRSISFIQCLENLRMSAKKGGH